MPNELCKAEADYLLKFLQKLIDENRVVPVSKKVYNKNKRIFSTQEKNDLDSWGKTPLEC